MVKQNPTAHLPDKFSTVVQETNPWGFHDRFNFRPRSEYPVRCTQCSRLMASDFLAVESECPNCHKVFTKAEARDAYIEAMSIKATHGGWTKEILDHLTNTNRSVTLGKDFSKHVIDKTAHTFTEWAFQNQDEMLRRERVRRNMIKHLRSQSPLSRL